MAVQMTESGFHFPEAEVRYPTPGPQSYGDPEHVAEQRQSLGLDAESPEQNGAVNPDRSVETKVVEAPEAPAPQGTSGAETKAVSPDA